MKVLLLKAIDAPWFGHGMSLLTSCLVLALAHAMRGDPGVHDMLVFLAGGSGAAGSTATAMRARRATSTPPPAMPEG